MFIKLGKLDFAWRFYLLASNFAVSILYVNEKATGTQDGGSWAGAFKTLSAAIATAQAGDELWVAQGTYVPGNSRTATFSVSSAIAIYGGFAGGEANRNDRNWQRHLTVLSGEIGVVGDVADNVHHVVTSNAATGATLDGVIIQGGNTQGATANNDGGGLYNRGKLALSNVIVQGNRSVDDGGGIRNDGDLTIINSTIANNVAVGTSPTSGGGGLLNTVGAIAKIINSTFSGNQAPNGGAIRNDSSLTLINTTLSGNQASSLGGGLINTTTNPLAANAASASAVITNSTIAQNAGLGIANFGSLSMANSIVANNNNNGEDLKIYSFGRNTSNGNNVIRNGGNTAGFVNGVKGDRVGTPQAPIDPLLGTLKANGGFTQTHAPTSNSVAIDGGNNNSIAKDISDIDGDNNTAEAIPFEQRGSGFERILNGTVDIGAVELNGAPGNEAPRSLSLQNPVVQLDEKADTRNRIKLADISFLDDASGTNVVSVVGTDAANFEIVDSQLFLKAGVSLKKQQHYDFAVQVDDAAVGASPDAAVDFRLAISGTAENPTDTGSLIASPNHFITVAGISEDARIRVSLEQSNQARTYEIIVVSLDEQGTLNGLAPDDDGYFDAVVEQSQVVFSTLQGGEFAPLAMSRTLQVADQSQLQFMVILEGSLDDYRSNTGRVVNPSSFSNIQGLRTEQLSDRSILLSFDLDKDSSFDDIVLRADLTKVAAPIGSAIQSENLAGGEAELIDLRGIEGMLSATFEVYREAKFDNIVGFFEVETLTGKIRDGQGNLLDVDDEGYVRAAMQRRVEVSLSAQNGELSTYRAQIAGGKLLSSFLVSNGTLDALLDSDSQNDPAVYFTHVGANRDRADHVRLLGDNTFGFEDLAGGGDQDFDDIVMRATFL